MRFADTSFWVGLLVPRDRRHHEAVALWRASAEPIRTSPLVLGETWTFLVRRARHEVGVQFLDLVEASPRVSIAAVDEVIDERAWRWLRRHDERVYSYVDATSFEIMRRERLTEALAFDGDFSAAGFIEVRPGPPAP